MYIACSNWIFFDGTNNNLARDKYGERIATDGHVIASGNSTEPSPELERSHSNVARVYEAYAQNDHTRGVFSCYLPGVGTRFVQIGESTESSEGKAFAKGGGHELYSACCRWLIQFMLQ